LHWSYNGALEQNSAGLFIANLDDPATIAGVLTAPPRGAGPAAPQAAAPAAGAPAASTGSAPQAGAAAPGQPAAPAASPPGRGRGAAAAHTPAYWIKISAQADGTFTVANSRNGFSKIYARASQTRPATPAK
jgi:hypothetical protein